MSLAKQVKKNSRVATVYGNILLYFTYIPIHKAFTCKFKLNIATLLFQGTCNFEGDLCQWKQAKDDIFDWTFGHNGTSSDGTGPSLDHTYGSQVGQYLHIEASR